MADVIQCGLYDYFELACMRRYAVSLELHDKEVLNGIASDLKTVDGKEYLLLKIGEGEIDVNLKDIDVLVLVENGERIRIS